jgi:hypothetical protein
VMYGRLIYRLGRFTLYRGLLLAATLSATGAWAQSSADGANLYKEFIRPLLAKNCLGCHGESTKQAGLDLSGRDALLRGGDDGPVVVLGDPNASRLYKLVAHQQEPGMPYKGKKLPDEAVSQIALWIRAGAPYGEAAGTMEKPEPTHWAFRAVRRPATPTVKNAEWVRNPIDAFVLAEQQKRGLAHVPEAERRVLLRRVYLDLIGLPPTPAEIHAFLSDRSKDAYEKVVDQLLASPRYGERWGRHWMDVWRYSDWYGNRKSEDLRNSQRHIWRWRDWIVDSLNEDKGYDRMIVEMLAGDELAPADPKVLAATGYLARNYFLKNRNTWLQDTVEYTCASFLAITMKCARCHSHKYDPIPQTDYYRLRAFFEPYDVRVDRVPGEVDVLKNGLAHAFDGDLAVPTYRFVRGNEQNPETANPLKPGIPGLFGNADLKIEPVRLPLETYYPDSRKFVQRDVIAAAKVDITNADKELKKATETLAKLDATPTGSWAAKAESPAPDARRKAENAVQVAQKGLVAAQAFLPALEARVAAENAARSSAAAKDVESLAAEAGRLEHKANNLKAEESLLRAQLELEAAKSQDAKENDKRVAAAREQVKMALDSLAELGGDSGQSFTPIGKLYPNTSTGRRLALARWIANGENPLTARVAINHIWLRHFGTALVPTVTNFGLSGKPPTHPELLDWLASELVRQGWSMKAIHRLMVTSSTYRMASEPEKGSQRDLMADPANTYLWRMNSHRMEAEVIRDSLLYVSGKLDLTMGGPDIDESKGEESYRRSVYFRHSLSGQVQFLKIFDAPSPAECFERTTSIVPQESLALTNSKLSLMAARNLARQLSAQTGREKDSVTTFINSAFEAIVGRPPLPEEWVECRRYLPEQAALYQNKANLTVFRAGPAVEIAPSDDADLRARESLVHVLLNHNEFLTVR